MNSRRWITWALSVLALTALAIGARAQQVEPSVDQIYQQARSGQLPQARAMIDQVVRNHPDSGKAHYVKAEIAARQGDASVARQELAQADRLSPGLPFAKPDAAQALRTQVQAMETRGTSSNTARMGGPGDNPMAAQRGGAADGMPWGKLLLGAAIVVGVMMVLRRRHSNYAGMDVSPTAGPVTNTGGMPAPGSAPGGYPQGPYNPNQGGYLQQGGGMGSSLGRGLATGLAVGAGAVAAQEIGHRMLHGRDGQPLPNDGSAGATGDLSRFDDPNANMGGQDFGLQDRGSWDTGGGGFDSGGDVGGGWDNS